MPAKKQLQASVTVDLPRPVGTIPEKSTCAIYSYSISGYYVYSYSMATFDLHHHQPINIPTAETHVFLMNYTIGFHAGPVRVAGWVFT
jgi:hypothetical protein